ncbi:MAG: tripartite tricarboxylate transporter substrate binding protein [Burkholderiales bacterium]|nr:tripartite tricarboxylate transporter substrate binding protein [Burkholderiales bacterium]
MIRRIGVALGGAAVALCVLADARPAGYPAKPVRIIVPFSAGSPIEIPARMIAQRLRDAMGQPFVIENRAGAGGIIGTESVARAPRDGYTILATSCAHSTNVTYYRKLPYDAVADFAPITQVAVTYGSVLVIHPSVPATSVGEFIALARSRPGELDYASAGIGSPPHVAAALFASMTGIRLVHVPYRGTAVAISDVLGGQVEAMFMNVTAAVEFVRSGRLRALGISGPRRMPWLPDVPTMLESGLSGFDLTCYHGMWFPSGTPPEIVRRVHDEIARTLAAPQARRYLLDNGFVPVGSSPGEFAEVIGKDIALHANIAKRIGIEPR